MKNLIFTLFFSLSLMSFSQTEREMMMIEEINALRANPSSCWIQQDSLIEKYIEAYKYYLKSLAGKTHMKTFMSSTTGGSDKSNNMINGKTIYNTDVCNMEIAAAKELIRELKKYSKVKTPTSKFTINKLVKRKMKETPVLSQLEFDSSMYIITKQHGEYLKSVNKVGHYDKDGDSGEKRMAPLRRNYTSENIVNENSDNNDRESVRGAILILLIDGGIPNRGHRKNLLNPKLKFVSVYSNGTCWIQNFAY